MLAAAISYLLAGSIVRPIRRVADASRALAEGASPDPLPTQGTAELASLSLAFNEMAAQLADSRDAERNFLLSVSHELKTPLTAIRGYAEGMAEGAFTAADGSRTILLETRRLERLVRDLLDLARMNRHEFQVGREPVDLAEVAHDVVARHQASAREYGVALSAEAVESWVEADHDRVLQIGSNLVENALRETPAAGSVTVRVEPGRLIVSDTGPGSRPRRRATRVRPLLPLRQAQPRAPRRQRPRARDRQAARLAMGGEVAVETVPGQGATFIVTLPSGSQPRRVDDLEVGAPHAP